MAVLIAYDVTLGAQNDVKNELKGLKNNKFFDFWTDNNNKTQHLPDTTLFNPTMSHPVQAKKTFDDVISKLNKERPANSQIVATHFVATLSHEMIGL